MNKRRGFAPLEIKASNGVSKRFLTGFTLIELLVVIAIIALLMSILMPALSKAKKQAMSAMCTSNQHQFGLLWKFYCDDNKGFFPERGDSGDLEWPESGDAPWGMNGWQLELEPYYGNPDIILCPAATRPLIYGGKYPFAAWNDQTEEFFSSYTINLWVGNGGGDGNYNQKCWRTPYTKRAAYGPILSDGNWKDMQSYMADPPPPYEGYGWSKGDDEMQRVCISRHGSKGTWYVNMCFLDFSMKKVYLKELWVTSWHKQWWEDYPDADTRDLGWPEYDDDWPVWMRTEKDFPVY